VAESNGQAQTAGGEGGATRLPLLNEPAPAFHARTTHGERGPRTIAGAGWSLRPPGRLHAGLRQRFIAPSKAYDRFQELGCVCRPIGRQFVRAHRLITNIKDRFGVEVLFSRSSIP
jgi:peroxiredoxin (alkyl hydroperoxide reductase subunit C)